MEQVLNTSRRSFLQISAIGAGGLMVGLKLDGAASAATQNGAVEMDAYVTIMPDGMVEIMAKVPDMGQGVKTSLPMLIAEEMDVDWDQVRPIQAPLDPKFGRQVAGGSRAIPTHYVQHRQLGAACRTLLEQAAAQQWRVSQAECSSESGAVLHRVTNRRATFAELAAVAATLPAPELAAMTLKEPSQFRIIGRPTPQVDVSKIVHGEPLFGIDFQVPGMLYATYVKAPVFGAKVKSADLAAARATPGVTHAFIVEGGEDLTGLLPGVAVVADSWWSASQAREKLNIQWEDHPTSTQSSAGFAARAEELRSEAPAISLRNDGDFAAAYDAASKTVEASYQYPFLSHANLEPQNCTAHWKDGKIEVWSPTQYPEQGLQLLKNHMGVSDEDVTIHVLRSGGGFGRRLNNDPMVEAAWISREVGAPVKVLFNREDDMRHDFYRPQGFHHFKAGLDGAGKVTAFADHFVTYGEGRRYATAATMGSGEWPAGCVENLSYGATTMPLGVPTGFMRAPMSNGLAFAFQSFTDELAHAAGEDPVAFQLKMLDGQDAGRGFDPSRAAGVLRRAAEMAGWGRATPARTGLGAAVYYAHSGYFGEVVEVQVAADGTIKPVKVWVAVDVGRQIVNPMGADNQVQGSVLEGLSHALHQKITIEGGAVQEAHFGDFPLLSIDQAPDVEVDYILSDNDPTGLGEPALPPAIPALTNAIFAATGVRIRSLPIDTGLLRA